MTYGTAQLQGKKCTVLLTRNSYEPRIYLASDLQVYMQCSSLRVCTPLPLDWQLGGSALT